MGGGQDWQEEGSSHRGGILPVGGSFDEWKCEF